MKRRLFFILTMLVSGCGENGSSPSSTESDTGEAQSPIDGGQVDPGTAWCATHLHTVCDDYEPDRDPTWELSLLGTGAAAAVSTAHATSAPNSLRVLAPAGSPYNVRAARVWKAVPPGATGTLHGEADVWVEAAPADTVVLKFFLTDTLVGVATGPTGLKVVHKLSSEWFKTIASGSALGTGAWHHVELDLNTSEATVSVKVDGTTALPTTSIPVSFRPDTPVEFYAGAELIEGTMTDTIIFLDNVAFDRN